MLKNVKPNMKVMHPLPRVTEIAPDVDHTPYAYYFQQARNGLFVRETLLALILGAVEMKERSVTIAKIENGIVIDHIPAGKAHLISQVLGLNALARETGDIIAIGVNFESPSLGKKDIIKVENLSLTRRMLNVVALIAPVATVTRIENGAVIEKTQSGSAQPSGRHCHLPRQILHHQPRRGARKFIVVNQDPVTLRCNYCETEFFGPLIRYKEKK